MPERYKKRILQRPGHETQSVTERPSEFYQLELPDFKIPTVTNSEDSVMTGLENRKWRDIWEHKGRASGINNTDGFLQQEHPSLFLLPFAPEVMGSGLGLGVLKILGGYAGSYVGSKVGSEVGYALDNTLNKQLFEPLGEIVGGFAGFGKGYNLFEKAGMQGALKYLSKTGKDVPRWFMRPELRTNVGRVNQRTFFAEDQTPKYNSNQITGHFGKVKYYGPTMGKTTAAAVNSKLVDFDDIIRQPSRNILDRYGFKTKAEMYNSGNREAIKAYEDMLVKSLQDWRANPENSNLTLVASPTAIANPSNTGFYFDNVPSIPSRDVFITRNVGRGGTPEASALWYDSLIKQNPNLKIDDRFVSQIESKPYQSPSASQLEMIPQVAHASNIQKQAYQRPQTSLTPLKEVFGDSTNIPDMVDFYKGSKPMLFGDMREITSDPNFAYFQDRLSIQYNRPNGGTGKFYINQDKLKQTIGAYKDLYTSRLNLPNTATVDDVYNHILSNPAKIDPALNKAENIQDILGLSLGYGIKDAMLFKDPHLLDLDGTYKETVPGIFDMLSKRLGAKQLSSTPGQFNGNHITWEFKYSPLDRWFKKKKQ